MWTRTLSKLQLERSKVNLIFLSSFPDKTCWAKCRAIYRHWIFLDISNFMFLFLSSSFFHCFLFLFSLSDSVTFLRVQSNVQIQVFLLTFLLLISHIYLFFSHFSFSQFLTSQILIFSFYVFSSFSHFQTKLVRKSAEQYRPWSSLDTPGTNRGTAWNLFRKIAKAVLQSEKSICSNGKININK